MTAKFVGHSQFSFTNQEWVRMFTKFAISEALTQRLWLQSRARAAKPERTPGAGVGACVAAKQLRLKLRPDSH